MPKPNMRIVYDRAKKNIMRVSISDIIEPKCKDVCPFHDESHIMDPKTGHCTNCDHCFSMSPDETVFEKQEYGYTVDDTAKNKKLVRSKQKKIVWECDQQLIGKGRYHMISEIANITIYFKDEDGASVFPTDRLVVKASNGKTNFKRSVLDGTTSSVNFRWYPPKDSNADVKFVAHIDGWHPLSYNREDNMIIELD